jgi:hypothetical protein
LVAAFLLDKAQRLRPHATRLLTAGVVIAFVVEQLTLYWIVAHRFTVGASGPVLYFLDPQWAPRVAAPVLLGVFVLALGSLALRGRPAGHPSHRTSGFDDGLPINAANSSRRTLSHGPKERLGGAEAWHRFDAGETSLYTLKHLHFPGH